MINYDLLNDKAKQTFLYIQLLLGFLCCPRTALSFVVVSETLAIPVSIINEKHPKYLRKTSEV